MIQNKSEKKWPWSNVHEDVVSVGDLWKTFVIREYFVEFMIVHISDEQLQKENEWMVSDVWQKSDHWWLAHDDLSNNMISKSHEPLCHP